MPYPYSYAYHHHHCHHHPVPPPVHTDLCVPYDDTRVWKALEDLHKHLHYLLDKEREQRKAADQALLDKLEQEIQDRKDADDVLQGEIDDLGDRLDQEIQDRKDGDTTIENYINNLGDTIATILTAGQDFTDLVRGTDYTLTWYNGYGAYAGDGISLQKATDTVETDKYKYTIYTLKVTSGSSNSFTNSHTVSYGSSSSAPHFKHTDAWRETSDCWICSLHLLGDWGTYVTSEQRGANVWNLNPDSARASWQVVTDVGIYDYSVSDPTVYLWATQISDGYNTQYYSVSSYDGCTFGLLNTEQILTFYKRTTK